MYDILVQKERTIKQATWKKCIYMGNELIKSNYYNAPAPI